MKFKLFVSKKKYDLISKEYLKLSDDYEELREEYKNSIEISKNNFLRATELESENEKLLLNEASFNNEIITLNQEIKLYEKTVKELEKEIDNLKKGNKALSEMWNDVNRKLWCNQESARQLRKLSEDILSLQKLDKNYIASYIRNISAYVGGGVGVEVKPKEEKENE